MMTRKLLFYSLSISLLLLASCTKTPGPGGKAIINVHVIDGTNNIPYTEIKIKYGATSFPGLTAIYDNTIIGDINGKNSFEGLQRGDYYIYTSYLDTSGLLREGGAYVKINNKPGEQHIVVDFGEENPF
jgi:hypothetical protein